ncbi:hypothetical protein ONZ45_g7328 [Pleurotus djamor]|nr:hypothetical protein ONZ45_g7328 [Pleurotus djamor]
MFPQEIYAIVIANLHDDKPSLEACSLVASSWRGISQALLHQTMVFRTTVLKRELTLDVGDEPGAQSSALRTHSLLNTSAHLLRHARCLIFRGNRATAPRSWMAPRAGVCCAPDPSLAPFLRKLSTLELPLLANIELLNLTWSLTHRDIRRALISLISQAPISEVRLDHCAIPFHVPFLAFVGPQTKLLRLESVMIRGDGQGTSVEDIPVLSGAKLIHLDLDGHFLPNLGQWILQSREGSGNSSTSTTTGLHSRSWHERITTLTSRYLIVMDGLVQALSNLTTLKLHAARGLIFFPFDEILRIPTLEYLHILSLPAESISHLLSSFETILLSRLPAASPTLSTAKKYKTICVHTYAMIPRITLPELLLQIHALDELVASLRNVEVKLLMTLLVSELTDDHQGVGCEATLVGLQPQLKALKLELF